MSLLAYYLLIFSINTTWNVSKYGIFSGPYFPAFGLNTDRYEVSLRVQSICGRYRPEKTLYLDTFHVVSAMFQY